MRAQALAPALLAMALAGCLGGAGPAPGALPDLPAQRPAEAERFHDAAAVAARLAALAAQAPDLAAPFELGRSVQGQAIPGLRITAPGDPAGRARVLVDGGIHGDEVYGAEAALYLAGWLVENAPRNATARAILASVDLHVVPLLNPDGRAANTRTNAHEVDLNRNFDVDFGNPNPLCRSQTVSPLLPYYYAGPAPLSEPETAALAALMDEVEPHIYLSHHTGRFALIRPWSACEPPHPMPAEDDALFEAIEAWTRAHTEIQNTGTADETAQRLFPPGAASGSSSDWCYLAHRCVALTLEVSMATGEGTENPAEVAETSLPIALHMLEHAADYAAWRIPEAARSAADGAAAGGAAAERGEGF